MICEFSRLGSLQAARKIASVLHILAWVGVSSTAFFAGERPNILLIDNNYNFCRTFSFYTEAHD
tara:strand:- start:100 stop:291 length:192 start_codon:yes stop_codon:yes gene_type:complete